MIGAGGSGGDRLARLCASCTSCLEGSTAGRDAESGRACSSPGPCSVTRAPACPVGMWSAPWGQEESPHQGLFFRMRRAPKKLVTSLYQYAANTRQDEQSLRQAGVSTLRSPSANRLRSTFLSNLPTLVLGTSSMKAQRSGTCHPATLLPRYSLSPAASIVESAA